MTLSKTINQVKNTPPISTLSKGVNALVYALNGRWHKPAMQVFMVVIILHLSEHIIQIFQLWVLGWERPKCMGLLGLWQPWLMKSEWLHYGHALFMLLGLAR